MPRLPLLAGIALAAIATSTQAHAYWVRAYPRYLVYPYPYAIAPGYVAPVVPYTYVPRPPVLVERYYTPAPQPAPPQYRYGERSELSRAQILPPQASVRPAIAERITLSAKELFDFDSAKLRTPQPRLDEIAAALKDNPQVGKVRITGHTDRIGTDSYNKRLSEVRANSVRNYLVAKGVAGDRLVAVGKGKSDALVECHDKNRADLIRCLEPNRRVEIEPITVPKR